MSDWLRGFLTGVAVGVTACIVLAFATPAQAKPQIGHPVVCFKLHSKPYCLVLR